MDTIMVYVCCRIDQYTGREKQLGIMTQRSMETCHSPYWEYTRKMLVPKEKWDGLHIGNVKTYLSLYEVY